MERGTWKKIVRWTAGSVAVMLLSPFVLFLILVILLYCPPIQNWAIQRASDYASEQTGMDIHVQYVRMSFPLDLDLQQVSVVQHGDTVMAVEHIIVDMDLCRILQGQVGIDALDINEAQLHSLDFIETMYLDGQWRTLHVTSDAIDLRKENVLVSKAVLDGCDLSIRMRDTTIVDTTQSVPIPWNFDIKQVAIRDSRIAIHMPADSMIVKAGIQQLALQDGHINLYDGIYDVAHFDAKADSILYDLPFVTRTSRGLDYNHLALDNVELDIDSIRYRQEDTYINAKVRQCHMHESCGLEIADLVADIALDTVSVHIPNIVLRTPTSSLTGRVDMEYTSVQSDGKGNMYIDVQANVSKADLFCIAGEHMPQELERVYPNELLTAIVKVDGNMQELKILRCDASLPSLLDITAMGSASQLMNERAIRADILFSAHSANLDPLQRWAGLQTIALPPMHVEGGLQMRGHRYTADATVREGHHGLATINASYDDDTQAYDARIALQHVNIHDFMPHDSIYTVSGRMDMNGRGFDLLSPDARLQGSIDVTHLKYGHWDLDNISLNAHANGGIATLALQAKNELVDMDAEASARLNHQINEANFALNLHEIDLYALNISRVPLKAALQMHAEGNSNLRDTHTLHAWAHDLELMVRDTIYHPVNLSLDLEMSPDTFFTHLEAGDLHLMAKSEDGWDKTLTKIENFCTEIEHQANDYYLNQDTLKSLLPNINIQLKSGRNNPIQNYLVMQGYGFRAVQLNLDASPEEGLNGAGYVQALSTGAMTLDTIQIAIFQDSTGVKMDGYVHNGPKNKQAVFDACMQASMKSTGAEAWLTFQDAKGKKGIDVGLQLDVIPDGLRAHFSPLNPIIAYRQFQLNADNYIFLHNDKRIEANLALLADDGTGLKIYSAENEDALQDLTLTVNQFNLGELSKVLPYLPNISGFLAGDAHMIQTETETSIMLDMQADNLVYEGASLGDVGLNGIYLPNEDGTHYVDGILSQNGNEVCYLTGTYYPDDNDGRLDAKAQLVQLPLQLANGFIPDNMAQLEGYVMGTVNVTGKASNPVIDGNVSIENVAVTSELYSLNLRFPNDSIRIEHSTIDLDRIETYASSNNPLVLDGNVDFQDLNRIRLNVAINAKNFPLIDAPKTRKAIAYGKVYVDLNARATGLLDDLSIRGKLAVRGNTDVTYVLKDSPLTVEDHLADLVSFVDFSDTTEVVVEKAAHQHIDMNMMVTIEEATHVHCLLSEDGDNYVDLSGGGDFNVTYTDEEDLKLYGRYTVNRGDMKYSMMIIPLKSFSIANGSYVEFNGDYLNPRLSLRATEQVTATVTENNMPRTVAFNVGLDISQTLENMGLAFTLEAPEDMTIQNELASMSTETRGRVAVTMLATGMYITDNMAEKGGFNTANALNSFLQGEINRIAGKAFNSVDLSFGMGNSTSSTGSNQTDYSFKFAKRFWNNRISVIIGGKVSSGTDAVNNGQTILNNVSLEYRLDKSATRYVRLFYDKNSEDILEGEVMEMGAGIILRRKTTRLGELFIFRKKED